MTTPQPHTAAFKIFHYPFICTTASVNLMDDEHLQEFGSYTTGDTKLDLALSMQEMHVQLTIAQIAELVAGGASVTLRDPAQSAKIYEIIREHLEDIAQLYKKSINHAEIPIDDIRALETLMHEMSKMARYYIPVHTDYNSIFTQLNKSTAGRARIVDRFAERLSRTAPPAQLTQQVVTGGDQTIAESIARFQQGSMRRWE